MTVFVLLAGIAIAAFVFAALLWSIYRAVTSEGRERLVHLLCALSTIMAMFAITYGSPGHGAFAGASLAVIAAFAFWYDKGWSKLLPVVQILFGIVLIVGLPWAHA